MNEFIPYIALFVSIISISISIYVAHRDRAKLKASCRAIRHYETDEYAYLDIKIANHGRRPAILRYLWGVYDNGSVAGEQIDGNVVLSEGLFYESKIGKYDGMMIHQDSDGGIYNLVSLYFEDSVGKKYKVKRSKIEIAKLWASKHKLGVRTHG